MAEIQKGIQVGVSSLGAEELKFTASLAERAASAAGKVAIVEIPGCPQHSYLIVEENGIYSRCLPEPFPRNEYLDSVDQVPLRVNQLLTENIGTQIRLKPTVYYDENRITIVHNDAPDSRRLDRTNVVFYYAPQFQRLLDIAGGTTFERTPIATFRQRELIKLFTRDLAGALPADESLRIVKALRALDFESNTSGTSNIGRGKESMGISIKEEVKSTAGTIPEMVTFVLPVHTDAAVPGMAVIRCLLEIDTKNQSFTLEALTGEFDKAIQDTVQSVGVYLRAALKDSVPIYCGEP